MKKKVLAVLLTSAMIAATLSGCGGKEESAPADSGAETDTAQESQTDDAQAESTQGETEAAAEDAGGIVSAPTELTFIFADGDEGAKSSMNEIVNRFNEAYPDITVTIEPGNGGAYSEFIKTKDSVGEFPDVMEMRDTAMYVRAGKLEPLSDEIVSFSEPPQPLTGKYIQCLLAEKIPMALFIIKPILMKTAGQNRLHMMSLSHCARLLQTKEIWLPL